MKRVFGVVVLAMALGLVPAFSLRLEAQSGAQISSKENLDLPYDAYGSNQEEEDAPEVVFFYGQQYEGDGFFFCLDRSGSTRGSGIAIEKRETIQTISQFSKHVEFAIVFYDRSLMKWPGHGRPAEASSGMKSSAISWLSAINAGSGTCTREGLLAAINFANRASTQRNQIIYLGDGKTTCPGHNASQYGQQTLAAVAAANYKNHKLSSICAGSSVDEAWCQALASATGGKYTRLTQ